MVAKLQMGTRASGEVELLVKDKDFGVAEAPAVTTQKARLNVFGVNSFVLSIGRFDFAAPTRALAINESGEGFMTRWRALTVSHIIRPRDAYDIAPPAPKAEAGAPPVIAAQPDAGDRWSTLIQAHHGYRSLRAEGSVVIGRRKTYAGGDGYYRTFGGDLLAAGGFSRSSSETKEPAAIWRGSVGAYRSHRSADASDVDSPDNDEGWALLGDASLGLLKGKKPRLTIGGTWARSSADRPETTPDESYVGESAAFAPDKIFLANLATKIADPRVPLPAGDQNPARLLRRGIAGKNYYGAGCILHDLSPIYRILRLAQVPGTDIGLTSTTVRFHRYTLREGIPAADASARPQTGLGKEVLIEFLAESPRGVRYQITTAAFFPEPLLKTHNLVTGNTWLLDARVTIALK